MSRIIVFLATVLMAGCATPSRNAFDSCSSGRYQLRIEILPAEKVAEMWGAATGKLDDRFPSLPAASGFVGRDKAGGVVVVIPALQDDSKLRRQLETWGHELAHVVCGDWHR